MAKIVPNSYSITLKVNQYLKDGGTKEALLKAMGLTSIKYLDERIVKQDWSPKYVKKLLDSGLIALQMRRQPRPLLQYCKEVTEQVESFVEELSSDVKICKLLGISINTYKNRVATHNWTQQELHILISKKIVDDSLEC